MTVKDEQKRNAKLSIEAKDISSIVAALQDSGWDQARVQIGDMEISVARNGAQLVAGAQQAAAAASAPTVAAPVEAPVAQAAFAPTPALSTPQPAAVVAPVDASSSTDHVITALSVGVFWRAPEPGAEPFVSVGDRIQPGDTLAIVEVMKLMSNMASDVGGVVTAIHVENGASVEHGTPLFSVRVDS